MLPSLCHTEQSHVTDWKDIFKQHTKTVGLGAEDPNQVLLLLLGYMLLGALWNVGVPVIGRYGASTCGNREGHR